MFSVLLNSLNNLLALLGVLGTPLGRAGLVLMVAANVPLYTLTPRFVINVRELYASETQACWDRDIDTGFGFTSRAAGSTTIGTIEFAEDGETGGMDGGEEIAMEMRTQSSTLV